MGEDFGWVSVWMVEPFMDTGCSEEVGLGEYAESTWMDVSRWQGIKCQRWR